MKREELYDQGMELAREGRNRKAIKVLEKAMKMYFACQEKNIEENFTKPEKRKDTFKLAMILGELGLLYSSVGRWTEGRLYGKDSQRLLARLSKSS